jgi:hypothetical protein
MGKNLNPFGGPQPTNRPTAPFWPMRGLANHRVVTRRTVPRSVADRWGTRDVTLASL